MELMWKERDVTANLADARPRTARLLLFARRRNARRYVVTGKGGTTEGGIGVREDTR
jgi:hypothetical protein